ncbi:serine hydrolase domain-containing protein [Sporobolomyces koalae]|uniref:serine hydrolase domain-containing protein n=1 Tax=Sporobolomyces koalae TaxID=500713 RepID=UPI003182ACBB
MSFSTQASGSSFPPALHAKIDALVYGSFDKYLLSRNEGMPRFAVLAATSTQDNIVNSVAGFERYQDDLESAPKFTDESSLPLWSATKLLTVISVLQLVEQGKVEIEEEASRYVKELRGMKVLTGFTDEAEEPIYEDAKKGCTVAQLLTHTAGFSFSYNPLVGKMEKRNGNPWLYAEDATRESLTQVPYVFQPGTAFSYGSSTDWLALLVADVSGVPFNQYLEKNLFEPLGIKDMTFENPSNRVDMATIPPRPTNAEPDAPAPPYTFSDMNFPHNIAWGGAGVSGSAKSYLTVLRMILLGGVSPVDRTKRILQQATVDSMFVPRLEGEGIMKSFLPFVEERSDPWSHKSGKQFEGCNHGYAGLLCGSGFPSGRSQGALAWSGAASTFWVVDREKDVAFVVWSCLIPHSHASFMDVWAAIEPLIYEGIQQPKA